MWSGIGAHAKLFSEVQGPICWQSVDDLTRTRVVQLFASPGARSHWDRSGAGSRVPSTGRSPSAVQPSCWFQQLRLIPLLLVHRQPIRPEDDVIRHCQRQRAAATVASLRRSIKSRPHSGARTQNVVARRDWWVPSIVPVDEAQPSSQDQDSAPRAAGTKFVHMRLSSNRFRNRSHSHQSRAKLNRFRANRSGPPIKCQRIPHLLLHQRRTIPRRLVFLWCLISSLPPSTEPLCRRTAKP